MSRAKKAGGAVAAIVVVSVAAFFGVQSDTVEIIVVTQEQPSVARGYEGGEVTWAQVGPGVHREVVAYYFNESLPTVARGWQNEPGIRFYAIEIDSVEVALTESDLNWDLSEKFQPQTWTPRGWTVGRILKDGELLDTKKDYGDRFLYPEAKR